MTLSSMDCMLKGKNVARWSLVQRRLWKQKKCFKSSGQEQAAVSFKKHTSSHEVRHCKTLAVTVCIHYTASNKKRDFYLKSPRYNVRHICTVFGMGHFSSFSMLSFFSPAKGIMHNCCYLNPPNLPKNRGREKSRLF